MGETNRKGEIRNVKRKYICAMGAVMGAVILGGTCFGMETVSAAETKDRVDIQILATSDLHGKFDPYDYAINEESTAGSMAQIQTAVKELRNDNTVLIDVGDSVQGNSAELFLEDDLHPMIQGMNLMDYDVWVTGNHEYDQGLDILKKLIAQQEATTLVGNVRDAEGEPLADGYTILERGGVKIAVIGMVTPNISRWSGEDGEYVASDPVEETRKIIDEIGDNVDLIIAAEHMGENNEYDVANSGVNDLAEACPEIDLILAAHEHKLVEGTTVNDVLIVENQDAAQTMAQVNFTLEKGEDGKYEIVERTSKSLKMADYAPDEAFMEELSWADEKAKEDANQVVGKLVGGDLVPENEIEGIPQARIQETPLMDLINEVQLYYSGADVSAAALFADNANMKEGDIRKCDMSLIYKFGNTLYKLEMTGAQLKKYMEWSASYYNTFQEGDLTISFNPEMPGYLYDMFSGVTYDINISKEPGSRIENLKRMDGTEIKDDDVLTIAVNNYRATTQLLAPGAVYEEGEELPKLLEIDVRGELGGVREMIGDYIVNVKGGTLEVPEVTGNWKLTGYSWDEEKHEEAVNLINEGVISLESGDSTKVINGKSITEKDLEAVQ